MLCVADCIRDCVWLAVPQPTEGQHLGNKIDAAMVFTRADFLEVMRARHRDRSYHFVFAAWRAKARNRIVKATTTEIECPLLNRQLVANHPRLCWFP